MADTFEQDYFEDEDWAALEADKVQQDTSISDAQQSLTMSVKRTLYSNLEFKPVTNTNEIDPHSFSIYELAAKSNMTVREYIEQDPRKAVRECEASYAYWSNILNQAAITGTVTILDENNKEHNVSLTKNQTKMMEIRLREAEKQLEFVRDEADLVIPDGKRKDQLIESMYQRAVRKGDTRSAMYLVDRVEGRPTETRVADLDYDNAYNIYAIIHTLFDKQLQVLNSGNGTKLVCCSRRAGKTHLLVACLLIECLRRSRIKCMYIGETAELSEGLINKAANDIIDACQLRDKRGKRFNWKKMDNGSEIMVRGLSNTKDPDQIRGAAAKVIVIDEFFHLKSELLEYLQREVLEPMQMDFADDYKFICAGTPPQIKGTYGEYVWKNWDVDKFSWTWRDNPHPVDVKKREAYVEKILHDKGLDWSSSFARREYNGEWAYDDDLLLYPEFHTYDSRESMPTFEISRVLFGIDYGVGDNDTLIGIAWSDDEKRGYQFWEEKFNRLDIKDRTISQLEYLCRQVKTAWRAALDFFPNMSFYEANKRILWDADDNDQHVTDYMRININFTEEDMEDLRLNIQNAYKQEKVQMFDKLNDALRKGDLLVMRGGKLEHELLSTIVKRGPNGEVYREVDDKAFHPDLLPAMRYAMVNVMGTR